MEKRRLNNWFTWNTNHHLRRPQASFYSPKGEEALRPPWSDLRSPGRISRLGEYPHFRWEFSHENGEQVNSFSERNGYGGELPVKYSGFGGRCSGTGGFLRLDHTFAYAKLPSSRPLPWVELDFFSQSAMKCPVISYEMPVVLE